MMISRGLFGWSPSHMQPLTPVSEVSEPPESPSPYLDPGADSGGGTGVMAAQAEVDDEMDEHDELEPPPAAVPFSQLFACSDRFDWVLMIVGSLAAAAHGIALIVYLHYFAKIIHVLSDSTHRRSEDQFDRLVELGHWTVLSSSDVTLELVDKKVCDDDEGLVMWFARFDGPGEGVSGLAHLVSMKFLSLRLVRGDQGLLSSGVRVELLQEAFDACDSLLENTRLIWEKSMIHIMSWLRPEEMRSETRSGTQVKVKEIESSMVTEAESLESSKQSRFDAAAFYEAIKPS